VRTALPYPTGATAVRILTCMRAIGPSFVLVVCAAAAGTARADIYSFTDATGVAHYSNVPADPRYVRIMAEPAAPQSAAGAPWQTRAAVYSGLIDEAARTADVSPALLRAVVAVESAFDPHAVSPKGAQGLMQLRPATAKRYGVTSPFDPRDNLRGGASYIRDLLKRYGNNLELALAAYNAGEDAVDRHGRTIPPFPETRAYVPAVLRFYRQFLDRLP
jgi:soluble lytic murein transglycosylase-like protein